MICFIFVSCSRVITAMVSESDTNVSGSLCITETVELSNKKERKSLVVFRRKLCDMFSISSSIDNDTIKQKKILN